MGIKMVNLYELIKYHPYHSSSFAEHANVTQELLLAAIQGEEELTPYEIYGIVRLTGVPRGVITCPRMIWLESKSCRHRKMVLCLTEKLKMISAAAGEGNKDAGYFVLKNGPEQSEKLINDFWNKGKVTYCRYLGVMAFVDMILRWMLKEGPRGLRKERKDGAA